MGVWNLARTLWHPITEQLLRDPATWLMLKFPVSAQLGSPQTVGEVLGSLRSMWETQLELQVPGVSGPALAGVDPEGTNHRC